MERNMEDINKEGAEIAKKLGNGVRYAGPQMYKGKLEYHLFEDDGAMTGTAFSGMTFEGAKENLTQRRILFNSPSPIF